MLYMTKITAQMYKERDKCIYKYAHSLAYFFP